MSELSDALRELEKVDALLVRIAPRFPEDSALRKRIEREIGAIRALLGRGPGLAQAEKLREALRQAKQDILWHGRTEPNAAAVSARRIDAALDACGESEAQDG